MSKANAPSSWFALFLGAWALVFGMPAKADSSTGKVKPVKVQLTAQYYNPNAPEGSPHLIQMMKDDPSIQVVMWSGLALAGDSRAPIMMSIAGETSPDIMESYFHVIQNDIRQGFLYPLNEWIGDDKNGDGQVSPEEAKWPRWKEIPELWRRVATRDGKIYGIPEPNKGTFAILFRTDLVREAGLDPNKPPKTWDEFYYWCMRLCDPGVPIPGRSFNAGQVGLAIPPYGFTWIPWIYAAGGYPIAQIRTDPKTGKEYTFPMEATDFHLPDGTDLTKATPVYRANFDSKEGIEAAALYHKLRWAPWFLDPASNEPFALTEADVAAGQVKTADGRVLTFTPAQVRRGVARTQVARRDLSPLEMMGHGEVAMTPWSVTDLVGQGNATGLNPDLLSWFPFPAIDSNTRRVVQVQDHYATMCVNVGKRSKAERDKVWQVLQVVTDSQTKDEQTRTMVLSGLARFVNPADLKRLGYSDYLNDVPSSIRENYADMESGKILSATEPYQGFWVTMDGALNREVLSLILSQTGENFDFASALQKVTHDANSGVMFARPKSELNQYRGAARMVFAVILVIVGILLGLIVRSLFRGSKQPAHGMVVRPFLPWMLLLPALCLIGLWGYYPLARGMVMAFQDFHIAGGSPFVGLDNFISLALDKSFWASMLRTLYYVFITMSLSFTAPIILAIMLSEVPRGKVFYRTLFFLPQVTSGLVVALIWKLMYDPNPSGILNQAIALLDNIPGVHIGPQSWLLDPKLAMVCCVVPTTWASAGIQSLLYLAALKGVPEETYEACEIDSGSILTKLRHITLPVLMPLIIINFVGAFIATFQNMGNIFLLTFGGPGEATMVLGMRIWIEAYSNLRFSIATSMAWVMGSCLIGFTFLQIQFLKRIEFRRAAD